MPHVDIELEDNKQFISNIPRIVPSPRTSIAHKNCVRETLVKRPNKIVQEIMQIVANVFSFYAITAIKHGFSMH